MKKLLLGLWKLIARFLPGLLLAVLLIGGYRLNQAFRLFGTEQEYRQINGFHYAESALRKTGLWVCAYEAAGTSMYYDTYFRDGESLTVFVVDHDMKARVFERIQETDGWHLASVTAQDYEQIAGHFRTPASLMRPAEDVVFDAFFYEDILQGDRENSYFAEWVWEDLPECLNMEGAPYTTDYRFAFYDQDTGLFICYDETM